MRILLAIAFSVTILSGCKFENKKVSAHSALGDVGEVMIFSDETTIAAVTPFFDSVWGRKMPSMGPYIEPYFVVRTANLATYEGYAEKNYNLFVLVHKENWDKVKTRLPAGIHKRVEDELTSGRYASFQVKDMSATPQIVFFVFAESLNAMESLLLTRKDALLEKAREIERKTTIALMLRTRESYDTTFQLMTREIGYGFRRPEKFRKFVRRDSFYGFSNTTGDKQSGVYTYSEPYKGRHQFELDYILRFRDSTLKRYIQGSTPDEYMKTSYEPEVPPTIKETQVNGQYAVEVRGWWELANAWRGGPFISYTIYSKKLGRVITIEGNVFAPNRSKQRMLRELELIISTYEEAP